MARQVASKKNREAARHTRFGYGGDGGSESSPARMGRGRRIENELARTGVIRGDAADKKALKQADTRLTQQNFGNRQQQASDIRAAFGVYG